MTGPRFYFVTNDADRAAREFSCHAGNLPYWIAVLDSFDDWMKIPAGSKCMGLWYGSAAELDGWRNAWAVRKERGDLIGVEPWELDTIRGWVKEHRERDNLRLLYGIGSDPDGIESDHEGIEPEAKEAAELGKAASSNTTGEHAVPPPDIIGQQAETVKRSTKWT